MARSVLWSSSEPMRAAVIRILPLLGLFVLGFACGKSWSRARVPDLGELMLSQQVHHTKLWLAGEAENWPLANYQLEELDEGFDTIVADHPTNDEAPVAPKDAIPRMVTVPLAELRDAVRKK